MAWQSVAWHGMAWHGKARRKLACGVAEGPGEEGREPNGAVPAHGEGKSGWRGAEREEKTASRVRGKPAATTAAVERRDSSREHRGIVRCLFAPRSCNIVRTHRNS